MKSFQFQPLESRMLRAAVTAVLSNGKLTVTGTDNADYIAITASPVGGMIAVRSVKDENAPPLLNFDPTAVKSIVINALGGNDTVTFDDNINLGAPQISIAGGLGNDLLITRDVGKVSIDGGGGNDTIGGRGTLKGGDGNDYIFDYINPESGYGPADYLSGDAGNDTIDGNGGNDTIFGGTGNDRINLPNNASSAAQVSHPVVDAGDGDDVVNMSSSGTIHLGKGNDSLGFDVEPDNDQPLDSVLIYGDAGDDNIFLTYRNPSFSNRLPIIVHGGSGKDHIASIITNNTTQQFYGDDDDDVISSDAGPTTLDGGNGDDTLIAGYNGMFLTGGDGNDTLSAEIGHNTLYGGAGDDSITGGNGDDLIKAEGGNDFVTGRKGNDTIDGGTGNDNLYGDEGNDQLFGSDGNDTLHGGYGSDKLYGQSGNDTIHAKDGGVDSIYGTIAGDNIADKDAIDVLLA